jgi:hypothetical protein
VPRVQEVISSDGEVVRRKPRLGDMRWDGTEWMRWSGRRWARAAYSLHPELLTEQVRLQERPPVTDERRQLALALAVDDQVAAQAASVILDGPRGVVLAYRRPVSHLFHAVMTLLTGGLWIVVWLTLALGRREDRIRLEADPWGNVWAQPVASA